MIPAEMTVYETNSAAEAFDQLRNDNSYVIFTADFEAYHEGNTYAKKYGALALSTNSVIDLNGHTFTGQIYILGSAVAEVTIKNGNIDCPIGYYGSEDKCVWVNNDNKTVIIENVTMTGGYAVYVSKGAAVIKSATVDTCSSYEQYGSKFSLNLTDNYAAASITVYGGTYKNYDPSDSLSENPTANFVAEGYKVIASEPDANGDIWYTVVEA